MQRSTVAWFVGFNAVGVALVAGACGGDDASSSSSSSTSSSSGSSSGASSSGASSGGSSGTSSSGGSSGTNDGGNDAAVDGGDGGVAPLSGVDTTFGTAGSTLTNAYSGHDCLAVMAYQSTGKLVVVGTNDSTTFSAATDYTDLVVGRLTSAGVVDTTFATNGFRLVHVGVGIIPLAATVQADDKVVVVGRTYEPTKTQTSLLVVRFTADGALDATFGTGGVVLEQGQGTGVGVQSDGKIVVTEILGGKLSVVRFTSAGVRDTTYGTGGVADGGSAIASNILIVQSDDKVVALGMGSETGKQVIVLARFKTDGTADDTFNTTGRVTQAAPAGNTNFVRTFGKDDNGRFLVESSNASGEALVTRFTAAGVLDGTFATGGTLTLTSTDALLTVQPDGKPIVGRLGTLRRYDATTGALDTTYGTAGVATPYSAATFLLSQALRASSGDVYLGSCGATGVLAPRRMYVSRTSAGGTADAAYGTSGNATLSSSTSRENPLGVVVQTDGKIVVAGGYKDFTKGSFLQRYTAAGAPDTTFGSNGFKDISDVIDGRFAGFALTPAGKFLVARGPSNNNTSFAVVQYSSDGTRDDAYGTTGVASLAPGASSSQGPVGMTIDNDGKALLVGRFNANMGLVRFTTAGQPDTTFGGGTGWVTPSLDSSGNPEVLHRVAVRADGKIIAAGRAVNGAMLVTRLDAAGAPDTTFDGDGFATFPSSDFTATSVILQPDDKIIVVGIKAVGYARTLVVARITSNGALDTTWNGTGTVEDALTASQFLDAFAPAVRQPDGSIVVATAVADGANQDMQFLRFTSSGVLDATFGTAGKLKVALSSGDDVPTALSFQADGKLVVAGRTFTAAGGTDVALLRLK